MTGLVVKGWQYRVRADGRLYVGWQPWERDDRPAKIGRWDAEYMALLSAADLLAELERCIGTSYHGHPVINADELLALRADLRKITEGKES